ncbi:MAG: hypothetical protein AB7I04_13780 [Pseudomonadales bacterium]
MKPFVPEDFEVPAGLDRPHFRLRMLRASDVQADYEAVMASAARLRAGSPHGWPRPGFTLAENLADLERHEWEFLHRQAFAYTVVAPDESSVLGCVYINPSSINPSRFEADIVDPHTGQPAGEGHAADVYLWVRDEHHPALTGDLLQAVRGWLVSSWPFERVRWIRTAYYLDDPAATGNGGRTSEI